MGSCFSSDGDGERRAPPRRERRLRSSSSSPYSSAASEEDLLHRAPGRRTFLNGASRTASLFTQQGKKGTNQDAMLVWENFGPISDTVFCGVFDGHGPYGHLVARRVRDYLPLKLSTNWEVNIACDEFNRENNISTNSEETAPLSIDEDSVGHPEIFTTLKKSFLKAFSVMDKELKLYPNIDCYCSGTTAVTLVKQGQDLVIGNVGDSRAVLGTRDQNDRLVAVQLTVDLKPNLPKEAERIKRCKGRVFALRDEPDVARVWLPNYDSPGLAMARAFGDFCLKNFGLISVPEISYRCLTEKDEFVVLASDGVWDVLSNKEVVDIVASAPARSSAARTLVESAVRAWRFRYPTSKIDDCAAVCLFLANSEEVADTTSISDSCSDTKMKVTEDAECNNRDKQQEEPSSVIRAALLRSGTTISGSDMEKAFLKEHVTADGNSTTTEDWEEWSALEGVARVNTLLTLPKFNDIG